jgi:hypothetical protein
MNTISVTFNRIRLFVSDPQDWFAAKSIAGKVDDKGGGVFEYVLSHQNLNRIYSIFTGPRKPVVQGGQRFLTEQRTKLINFNNWRKQIEHVQAVERMPIEPNGKFTPYAHQTKIVGGLLSYPFLAVMADCGTGKTGSQGRAIELAIQQGLVQSGKVLVSAPLSILEASWGDDLKKFTHLRFAILWPQMTNKRIHGEKMFLQDCGPKPDDAITARTSKCTVYRNVRTGEILDRITALDSAAEWQKFDATVKVAKNSEGVKTRFGEMVGRSFTMENTREIWMAEQLARNDVDVFLINHDGVRLYEDLLKQHSFDWVIVDESTKIKSMESKVTKAHVDISWKAKRRTIMSGTPNPNGFLDLWSQFYFLDRGLTLHPTMKDYLNDYFRPIEKGHFGGRDAVEYVPKSNEHQKQLISHVRRSGIYLQQRDCIDLPPRTDMKRYVYLTPEQQKAYEEMEEQLFTELKDTSIEAVNTLSKIMKLRQITSGFVVGNDGTVEAFSQNPKLEDLDDFLEELGENKLVVACQFREEIQRVLERYKHHGVSAIYGDVPVSERAVRIRDFQTKEKPRLMVLQPQAAAHGITLTQASYLLFLSLDYNFEYYYQTAKRIERLGQKNHIFVVHSLARFADGTPTIDEDLLDVLGTKGDGRTKLFSPGASEIAIATELRNRLLDRVEKRK